MHGTRRAIDPIKKNRRWRTRWNELPENPGCQNLKFSHNKDKYSSRKDDFWKGENLSKKIQLLKPTIIDQNKNELVSVA